MEGWRGGGPVTGPHSALFCLQPVKAHLISIVTMASGPVKISCLLSLEKAVEIPPDDSFNVIIFCIRPDDSEH